MAENPHNLIQSDIDNRNKELQCLFRVDEILTNYDSGLEQILQQIIGVIPEAMTHSTICAVAVQVDDVRVESEGYKSTQLKIAFDIIIENANRGMIEVVYTRPVRNEKGIFTSDEYQMLKTIASKISSFLLYKQLRETITHLQKDENASPQDDGTEKVREWLRKQSLSDEEIRQMLKVKIEFGKGETICKQGAIASYVILLTEGLSKNYLEGYQERGFNFKIIRPMDFIGLSSLYGNKLYAFSSAALTKCEAYLIDSQLIKNIVSTNSSFNKRLLNWYCETTQGHLQRLSSIANKQSLGRLAEILLYLSDTIFDGSIVTTNVSRKDIAELAAISTESAVRFLSDFKKEGIIRVLPNRIEILKKDVLKMISEG